MKRLIHIITSILIITAMFTQIAIAEETQNNVKFTDLDETYWAYESIQKLVDAEVIVGYPDGTFKPDGNITRAELVKMANLVFSYVEKQETTNFTDITADDWFYDNVLIAQNSGYINGYEDGTFKPNNDITRQELCKILDSINIFVELPYDNAVADEVSPWAVEYVNKIVTNRVMALDENNNFRATEKATRAEVCDALAKFLIIEEEPEVETPSGGGSTGNTDEGLTDDELNTTMDTVTRRLEKGVIPNLTSEAQKEIVNDIISNMEAYQNDNTYDYESAADDAYEKYKKLSSDEKDELKYQIQLQNSTKDLLELKDFFFPDVDID
nr:S-layer homology domain-containing protein [Sedimentibacter sp.]